MKRGKGRMALLAWIPSQEVFLKVQVGMGDNLSEEELRSGYIGYTLWSSFRAKELDIDQELDLDLVDGGMVLYKETLTRDVFCEKALANAYEQAFGRAFDVLDAVVLVKKLEQED